VNDKDEIKLHIRGRYLCSMDAMWRILGTHIYQILKKLNFLNCISGYHTYPSPNPSVKVIKVKSESEMNKIIAENKVCDLQIYFNRPPNLRNLTYASFFQMYTYSSNPPQQSRNTNNASQYEHYQINISYIRNPYFIYTRNESSKNITRLEMVPLTIGEKCYLRLILYRTPVLSFIDARTVNGITYNTFQLAALAKGLVEDENEAIIAFQWATTYSTPAGLRTLFVIMTLQGFPTLIIYENNDHKIKLMEDYLINCGNNIR